MNRVIVYPGAIPQDTDLLQTNKNTMIALGYLTQAILGSSVLLDGLACTPTSPATMSVNVATGSIYTLAAIDSTAYGSVAADTADQVVKQGIAMGSTPFTMAAPATSGQSVVYLIEAQYQDADGGSMVLPYYNASNPSVAYSGPGNAGTPNYTLRQGKCVLAVKAGTAAATGSQVTPTPDAGYTGLWAITVANGQTTITSANIAAVAGAPFITAKLTGKLSAQSNLSDVASASDALANLGGAPLSAFGSLTTGYGYQHLPGGLIIQWGVGTVTAANTFQNFSLPIAFPNAFLQVTGSSISLNSYAGASIGSTSLVGLFASNAGAAVSYIAMGH